MSARSAFTFALLACGISGYAAAVTWSDLWSTPEQQGQHLLDANHPAEAARLFSDPKRRAYAQLQAGQYAKAADLLAPLEDADSQYNRGNALAHTGKLREALAAYDAALASSPGNKDVIRNRDLVAKALENQQHPQQGNHGSPGQSGQGQGQQGQSSGGGQGANRAGGKSGQDGSQGQAGNQQGQAAQQGQAGNQQGQAAQQGQGRNQQPGANQAAAANRNAAGSQPQATHPAQDANPAGIAGAAQAQNPQQTATAAGAATNKPGQRDSRDTAALQAGQASGTGTQQGQDNVAESPLVKGSPTVNAPKTQPPRSEQALALDQWLRGIPEDSGELLRRKFMIEHMLKQQGNEP